MNVQIQLDRQAAIRAGCNRYGTVTLDIDPADLTAEEREALALAPITSDGINLIFGYGYPGNFPPSPKLASAEDPLAAAREWLHWRMACNVEQARVDADRKREQEVAFAKAEAAADAYIAYWRDQPAHRFIEFDYGKHQPALPPGGANSPRRYDFNGNPEARARVTIALAHKLDEAAKIAADRESEHEARKEAKEREEAAKVHRRAMQILEWVAEYGTENQRERHALDLLPEQEVLDEMEAQAFALLSGFPRAWDRDADDRVEYEDEEANGLTADEFDVYRQIRQALPEGATLTPITRAFRWPDDDYRQTLVQVEITVGEFTFTREYSLPGQ